MAASKTGNRSLSGLEERPAKDYDPEGDASQSHLNDSESGESEEDDGAGTEHYASVGKSKLRRKDVEVALGPQYRGARVSRAALEEGSEEEEDDDDASSALNGESGSEEFDDPDEADLEADWDDEDAEIDSDNALGESDVERFKKFAFSGSSKPQVVKGKGSRKIAADFYTDSEDEGSEDEQPDAEVSESSDEGPETLQNGVRIYNDEKGDGSKSGDMDDSDDDDQDEESEGEDASDDDSDEGADDQRAELRKIMSEGQKNIMATVSQAAKADAEKGTAVRQQRRAFDSLLNVRIRLQKALVATNSFGVADGSTGEDDAAGKEPYEAAEEAAVKLWSAIDGFRRNLLPESAKAKIGQKRKREDVDIESTDQSIWDRMEETEELALGHRRKVLDKWSAKVRNTITTATTRKLGPTTTQSLVSVLDDQLLSADRLVKRTRTPRSCAPAQAAKKVAEDPEIYDDADFYQLLLKELVDQRTMDSSATGGGAGATVRWAALKEAKTRKQVDRKASKGRKLRFTVHEKLQNFMAPEDRRDWEQDAIDRFFGTLFGQRMELKEGEDSDEEMGGASVQDEGLRLF